MTILDSNVWIAIFNKEDSLHDQAVLTYQKTAGPFLIPEYIVVEVLTILKMRAGSQLSTAFFEYISQNKDMAILPSNQDFFTAVTAYFNSEPLSGLSFTDVSLLYLSREHTIITFDKKLHKALAKKS